LKSRVQVEELARLHDRTLGAGDFTGDSLVSIRHSDGTQLHFRSAFLMKHEGWAVVFTEHNGTHCFYIDHLEEFAQYDRRPEIGTL
jgi:hypothetical protein